MHLDEILNQCVEVMASDCHLLPTQPPLARINGELQALHDQAALAAEEAKTLIYSGMDVLQQQQFEQEGSIDYALTLPGIGHFRVSVLHQQNGIAAVYRVIPDAIPSFEKLMLPPIFKRLISLPHGLILVTGPTGSGKSTTLATLLNQINTTRATHILTIEDPIEYIHHSQQSAVTQIQVGRDTPSFAKALRAALRQDPDIIMIGELRDQETIRLALTAAETGHLVFSTLHASSAPLAISRIVDIFPLAEKTRVRNLLSEAIQAVICQTLVKRLNGGRMSAFEIMLATPAIRHLIRQDMIAHMQSTIQTSGDIGMCTMEQYLQELVAKRLISTAVARSISENNGFSIS